jgi:hypothetical protein
MFQGFRADKAARLAVILMVEPAAAKNLQSNSGRTRNLKP